MKQFDNFYSYEDNQKIIYLVVDRQSHFVVYSTNDITIAKEQMKECETWHKGREFTIICYPMDVDEIIYLLKSVIDL